MKKNINWKWIYDCRKKYKSEQEIEVEKTIVRIADLEWNLDKTISFIVKGNKQLRGHEDELSEILQQFMLDVYESSNLK